MSNRRRSSFNRNYQELGLVLKAISRGFTDTQIIEDILGYKGRQYQQGRQRLEQIKRLLILRNDQELTSVSKAIARGFPDSQIIKDVLGYKGEKYLKGKESLTQIKQQLGAKMTKQSLVLKPHLRFSLINIKRIDCRIEERDLNRTDLELDRGADLILEARGVVNPLVVKRTNNVYNGVAIDEDTPDGRYELINGFFEYFCAVRARAIDPSLECIQAWVCSEKNTKALENQLSLFREDDNYEDDFFALDFELVENNIEDLVDKALAGKSLESCFDAAQHLCNLYPDPDDRNNALEELESIKKLASGDRTYQKRLDNFFAEAGGLYE